MSLWMYLTHSDQAGVERATQQPQVTDLLANSTLRLRHPDLRGPGRAIDP